MDQLLRALTQGSDWRVPVVVVVCYELPPSLNTGLGANPIESSGAYFY